MEIKHAISPLGGGEFTVCGMAFDAYESGDHNEPILFADVGEPVTCLDCRRIVVDFRGINIGRLPSGCVMMSRALNK